MKPGRGGLAGLADAARDTAKQTLVKYKPWDGSFLEWAAEHRNFRGKPFGLAGHEYLREPYETMFQGYTHMIMEKAAQMGASELAMTWALYFCDKFPRTKTIFFFPTDEKVKDFSSDRLAPIIDDSPRLHSICRGTQNSGLKHIGLSSIYLRGMYAKEGTKSVNADCLIFDELDESKRANKRQALQRIKHSEFRYIFELSTPTLPGFGIDEQWVTTDQRFWHLACRCPEGCVLEDHFPECVVLRNGEWVLRCPTCGKEDLDPCEPATVGEYVGWLPLLPERQRRGYHLTQLFSTVLDREETMEWWDSGKDRDEFYNSVLGKPFAGDRMPLPMEVLNRCKADGFDLDPRRANMNDRIFVGVDQGNTFHVTIWKEEAAKRKRLMWAQRLTGRDPFGDLADLLRRVKPTAWVIDDGPNTVPARQLVREFKGGWTCAYQESAKDELRWDRDRRMVVAHRTDTLDEMAQEWQGQNFITPGGEPPPEECVELFKHLAGLAKKQETNPLTGVEEIVYITNGADHYAHSTNYAHIASQAPGGRCSFDLL
jgi:hypothetical protein